MINWPAEISDCKYRKWYENLISKSKHRNISHGEYFETHHIIPRSLGGNNSKENLVKLYAREHYIAHLLLWKMKMTEKNHNKMTMALHVMVNGSGNKKQNRSYLVPSRIYEKARLAYSILLSEERRGEGNSFYGKNHSDESIQKIKEANIRTKDIRSAKLSGEGNGMYGKNHTDETRAILSEKSKAHYTEEVREKYSERLKKQWQDPEFRQRMLDIRKTSEKWKNRDWSAIAAKTVAGKIANGTNKMPESGKKKLSETRKAKIASGEIVPWNKGKKLTK